MMNMASYIPQEHDFSSTQIITNDGVRLRALSHGTGRPIVFVHGYAQSALGFGRQIGALGNTHQAVAIDLRGHGGSEKPNHGYRVGRLAADLNDVFAALKLSDITLVAHSMGCGVVWAYLEQYGFSHIRDLVLIDRPTCLTADPTARTPQQTLYTPDEVFQFAASLRGTGQRDVIEGLVRRMMSPSMPAAEIDWFTQQSLLVPFHIAASLFIATRFDEWRDFLKTITCPTLVIAAENSMMPVATMQAVTDIIPNATFKEFTGPTASHFMFWEQAEDFNQTLRKFIASSQNDSF